MVNSADDTRGRSLDDILSWPKVDDILLHSVDDILYWPKVDDILLQSVDDILSLKSADEIHISLQSVIYYRWNQWYIIVEISWWDTYIAAVSDIILMMIMYYCSSIRSMIYIYRCSQWYIVEIGWWYIYRCSQWYYFDDDNVLLQQYSVDDIITASRRCIIAEVFGWWYYHSR